ncbi:hypothetical protein K3495_g12171, partial [Podosphaera aphanis]
MVDTGCLCFSVIDENLVRKHNIHTKSITPRQLRLADNSKVSWITHVAGLELNICGRQEWIWGYIMPNLAYPLILGKPWMEKNEVVYSAGDQALRIGNGFKGVMIKTSGRGNILSGEPKEIKKPKGVEEGGLSNSELAFFPKNAGRGSKLKGGLLGAISENDFNKALEKREAPTREEVEKGLPTAIRRFTSLFLEDGVDGDVALPPNRPGVDTQIRMLKDEQGRDKQVPWGPLYNMSKEELLVLRKTLTELLNKNWIRASSSPGGAPVLFIKKPGGGLRFCVDYRALNAVSERDRYPLPLIRETMRMLSGATFLTKVDVRSAFHRLRISEGDEWKTAFRTRFGSFEWLVTPFGLAGAPSAFQRWINKELGDLLGVTCSAYVDDVVIFSNGDLDDHWNKVRDVIERLFKAGLKLDPNKCEFARKEIKYLGFLISVEEGIKVDPEKIKAIETWAAPTSTKGVRSFLGFANFYRAFIADFAQISTPLQEITKKGATFVWKAEQQWAFDNMKSIFTKAPILAMWNGDYPTILETDASGWATGGCLLQRQPRGEVKPVAYYSKKLSPAECNYDIHDKELLAIIRCLNEWRSELIGLKNPFLILTDHKNLRYFMTSRRLSERQVRWSQILSQFNFRLEFRAGKLAERPDALSRREQDVPTSWEDPRLKEREFILLKDTWLKNQVEVQNVQEVVSAHRERVIPPGSVLFEDEEIQSLWDKAVIQDTNLASVYKTVWMDDPQFESKLELKVSRSECEIDARGALCFRKRLWIPAWEPLQTALIQRTHDSHVTGHPGRNSTIGIMARTFFWPGMTKMIRRFCKNCDVCGRTKVWRSKRQGLLLPLPVPERFYSELSIDFMTDLPAESSKDPKYLMVITDRLLKSVTLEAMQSMNAEECAERFLQCHYRFHGFPNALTSDRGSNWVGEFWSELCRLTKIDRRLSTAFHPETDGATERMNQEVLAYLRAFISFSQLEWAAMLPTAQLALNNRDSSTSQLSPFFLTHGYHVDPVQLKPQTTNRATSTPAKRAERFVNRLVEAQEFASAAMAAAQQNMEEQANKKRSPATTFRVGDKVWLCLKNIATPQLKKKLAWVNAKYSITRVISPHVVELDVPTRIYPRFNVDLLRKASEDPLPSQYKDDVQPAPLIDPDNPEAGEEQVVERILRAERIRRGRGWVRRVLVKWKGFAEPTWENRSDMEDVEAMDRFESKFGTGDGVGEKEGSRQGKKPRRRSRGGNVTGCAHLGVGHKDHPSLNLSMDAYRCPGVDGIHGPTAKGIAA